MKRVLSLLLAAMLATTSAGALAAVSRDDAAAVAQRETGGRVLSVDRTETDGRAMWRVKVVTARGDVRVLMIDALTGQVR